MVDKPKIPVDLDKLTDLTKKIDFKGIVGNVKSIIGMGEPNIPEDAKDDPIGYHLANLTKIVKALEEYNGQQADMLHKLGIELGDLYKQLHPEGAPAKKPAAPQEKAAAPKAEDKKDSK